LAKKTSKSSSKVKKSLKKSSRKKKSSRNLSQKKKSSQKKVVKKKSRAVKTINATLLKEIVQLFERTPLIPTAAKLIESLSDLENREGISSNKLKKILTEKNILSYSKKKPSGYSLNIEEYESLIQILETQTNFDEESQVTSNGEKNIKKSPLEDGETEQSNNSNQSNQSKRSKRTKQRKQSRAKSTPKEKIQKDRAESNKSTSTDDILDRIPSFPQYLLNRMSKHAQRSLNIGALEINRMSCSDLENCVDHLSGARILYDEFYENEKEILDTIETKVSYINRQIEVLREKEGEILFRQYLIEPLAKGKFDKILKNLESKGVDECAWEILKKIGRKINKIPLSEFVIRKKLIAFLHEKYNKS
jgi:hypothetical protein